MASDKLQKAAISSLRLTKDGAEGKEKIPEGAKILKKDVSINVEEIENGYLICKSYDVKYTMDGKENNYCYWTEKYYSETNPVSINTGDKEVADFFDEEDDNS